MKCRNSDGKRRKALNYDIFDEDTNLQFAKKSTKCIASFRVYSVPIDVFAFTEIESKTVRLVQKAIMGDIILA